MQQEGFEVARFDGHCSVVAINKTLAPETLVLDPIFFCFSVFQQQMDLLPKKRNATTFFTELLDLYIFSRSFDVPGWAPDA